MRPTTERIDSPGSYRGAVLPLPMRAGALWTMATVRAMMMLAWSANVASKSRVAVMWAGSNGVPRPRASWSTATSSARSKRHTNMGRVRPFGWWVTPTSVPNKQKVTRNESPFSPPASR
uniref:Uncharacterized protein n=1 Tax=Human herpesvirus 2 TaxID=10310 RepID=A0A481T5D0_HHV2|nr:hypothetical protein [Human alphaherpesvirus 2]QBH79334.1 hypothetical protein [Human alphaherpesvirus 2]QBH79677.1 hypothetical protein [Human alphaherpesvirus 2]QBH79953.1 hypothetical protein [Human alphaherpesvirus 2]QBH80606.1 hypothetical protein [Human alphaherpesvirus 2]